MKPRISGSPHQANGLVHQPTRFGLSAGSIALRKMSTADEQVAPFETAPSVVIAELVDFVFWLRLLG